MHAPCGSKSLRENTEARSTPIRIRRSHTRDFLILLIWSKYAVTAYFVDEQTGLIAWSYTVFVWAWYMIDARSYGALEPRGNGMACTNMHVFKMLIHVACNLKYVPCDWASYRHAHSAWKLTKDEFYRKRKKNSFRSMKELDIRGAFPSHALVLLQRNEHKTLRMAQFGHSWTCNMTARTVPFRWNKMNTDALILVGSLENS